MAAKKSKPKQEPQGSVAARRAAEAQRQADAQAERARIVAEAKKS